MNTMALLIGMLVACFIVFKFRKSGYENSHIAYPLLLATFPVYYWCFALYANNLGALQVELLTGVIFMLIAFVAAKSRFLKSQIWLAIGFIGHGLYDVLHRAIFTDSVAPIWWPEFCGVIDIVLGAYVLWLIKTQYSKTRHQPF